MIRIQLGFMGFLFGLASSLPSANAASGRCGCERVLDPRQSSTCAVSGPASSTREFFDKLDSQRNQQLRSQAEGIIRNQSGSEKNQLWARGILRQLSEKDLASIRKIAAAQPHWRNQDAELDASTQQLSDTKFSESDLDRFLSILGVFNDVDEDFLNSALGKNEIDATLDGVFAASMRGELSHEHHERRASEVHELQAQSTPQRSAVALGDQMQPDYMQMYLNLIRQVKASRLFLGFADPEIAISVQTLRLKPYSQWSESAKAAIASTFPYHSGRDIGEKLADSWIYVYFGSSGLFARNFFGVPTILPVFHHEFILKDLNSDSRYPPAANWMQRAVGLNFNSSIGTPTNEMTRALNSAGYYVINPSISLKNSIAPGDNPSGFALPLEIVDWRRSVISFSINRKIPTNSLVLKWHNIQFLATNLGREVVMVGGSSGRLQEAALRAGASYNLPLHWNMIPPELRIVPTNLTELDAYLTWLEQVRFELGNRLPGQVPTNRRLGGP